MVRKTCSPGYQETKFLSPSWQVVASVHYAFSDTWLGILGYRAFDVDYADDNAVMALGLKSVLLGLGISF